ncbi:MAG: type II toxin-antitoxin system RelE/ParE family toxin [Burkholderiales bacterium]
MSYVLHRLAEHDLQSAFQFYREKGSDKVALRFLAEFDRVAELLVENPGIGTPVRADRRRYPIRTYPYSVIYKVTAAGIRVLAVSHQRREPSFGLDRN